MPATTNSNRPWRWCAPAIRARLCDQPGRGRVRRARRFCAAHRARLVGGNQSGHAAPGTRQYQGYAELHRPRRRARRRCARSCRKRAGCSRAWRSATTRCSRWPARSSQRQSAFLEHGEEHMQPMILRDIAAAIEMHESTVSRITSGKYMHTPRGVFELRYFFSSQVEERRRRRHLLDRDPRQDQEADPRGRPRQSVERQPHRRAAGAAKASRWRAARSPSTARPCGFAPSNERRREAS